MMPTCKYFVIKTGYTARLLFSSLKNLENKIDWDEIPACIDFIYDAMWGDGNKGLYTVKETNLDKINHVLSHTARYASEGIIVFSPKNIFERIEGCEEAKNETYTTLSLSVCYNIANIVKDLNYCNIVHMEDIEYIFHKDGNIIIFDYRAESE